MQPIFFAKKQVLASLATASTWFDQSDNSLDGTNNNVELNLGDIDTDYEPSMRYNGVDSKTVVANDANLNFGANSDFSIAAWVRTTTTVLSRIIDKGSVSGTDKRYVLVMLADGTVTFSVDDSANTSSVTSTSAINDGGWHLIIETADRDGNLKIYVDGALEDTDDMSAVGDIDDTAEPLTFGIRSQNESSDPFEGDMKEVIIYNRVFAPKEIEQMALGVPVPKPLIIGDNSSMNTIGDWIPQASVVLTGGYDSGDAGHETTLRLEAGATSSRAELIQSVVPTVAGRRYLLTFQYKWISVYTLGVDYTVQVGGTTLTKTSKNASGWTEYTSGEFTATDDSTPLRVYAANLSGASATNELLVDNAYLTDLDTLVTFPLVIDQWGSQTDLTSGTLTVGETYRIDDFQAGDDFTNVGASSNTTGVSFTATGTTPTTWTNSSILHLLGAVAHYKVEHENAYSPFQFTKGNFLPRRELLAPNQRVGKAGSGQLVIDDLGDVEELFPIRIMREGDTVAANYLGFFQDPTVNYSESTFTFVDEEDTNETVRVWPVGNFPVPVKVSGGLHNFDLTLRKEIS